MWVARDTMMSFFHRWQLRNYSKSQSTKTNCKSCICIWWCERSEQSVQSFLLFTVTPYGGPSRPAAIRKCSGALDLQSAPGAEWISSSTITSWWMVQAILCKVSQGWSDRGVGSFHHEEVWSHSVKSIINSPVAKVWTVWVNSPLTAFHWQWTNSGLTEDERLVCHSSMFLSQFFLLGRIRRSSYLVLPSLEMTALFYWKKYEMWDIKKIYIFENCFLIKCELCEIFSSDFGFVCRPFAEGPARYHWPRLWPMRVPSLCVDTCLGIWSRTHRSSSSMVDIS